MRFTTDGGLFQAAYEGAYGSRAAYNHEELASGKDKKFNVLHVPVLENNKGVPFEITAKESGKSYLTGPALRILSKNNKYDEHNPFIFFPLLKAHHSQG
ncbi:hypothetical protein QZH41_011451 [Actinostola sp. cb2023]|nr:hypothetical protein QZH41_011451 [Actinostola sp. cb2023]